MGTNQEQMTTKVVSVVPVMDQQTGQQKTWTTGQGKTMFTFFYVLENGMKGEASHQTPEPRFPLGSEVVAKDKTNPQFPQYPKLDLNKPGAENGFSGKGGGGNWSPQKEASVMIQGLLKSLIQSGVKSEHWADALKKAISVHDEALALRAPKPAPAPAPMQQAINSIRGDENDFVPRPGEPEYATGNPF